MCGWLVGGVRCSVFSNSPPPFFARMECIIYIFVLILGSLSLHSCLCLSHTRSLAWYPRSHEPPDLSPTYSHCLSSCFCSFSSLLFFLSLYIPFLSTYISPFFLSSHYISSSTATQTPLSSIFLVPFSYPFPFPFPYLFFFSQCTLGSST